MPFEDTVPALRAELAILTGRSRTGTLVALGQALTQRYWRTGPGRPEALPDLSDSIAALREAYGYLDARDPLRGHVAALFGWLLGARHLAHGGRPDDRDTGLTVLEDGLTFPGVPQAIAAMARMVLGQLYVSRAAETLKPDGSALAAIMGGAPTTAASDVERAITCFQEILAGRVISDEIHDGARTMLALAEAMRTLFGGLGGGPAGVDFGKMMEAMQTLQGVQAEMRRRGAAGSTTMLGLTSPPMPSAFDAERISAGDSLDYPVAVVQDAAPAAAAAQPIHRPEAAAVDRTELRHRLRDRLSAVAGITATGHPTDVWVVAAALLRPTTPVPPPDVVDNLVALASLLVDSRTSDMATDGVDEFLLAVSLHLRAQVDPTGAPADHRAAAQSLLAALQAIPAEHPAAVSVLWCLGAFLGDRPSRGDVVGPVCVAGADRIDAVMAAGTVREGADLATLHALRCFCRSRTGPDDTGEDLGRAVGAVPLDYPWLPLLRGAANAVRRV